MINRRQLILNKTPIFDWNMPYTWIAEQDNSSLQIYWIADGHPSITTNLPYHDVYYRLNGGSEWIQYYYNEESTETHKGEIINLPHAR